MIRLIIPPVVNIERGSHGLLFVETVELTKKRKIAATL